MIGYEGHEKYVMEMGDYTFTLLKITTFSLPQSINFNASMHKHPSPQYTNIKNTKC